MSTSDEDHNYYSQSHRRAQLPDYNVDSHGSSPSDPNDLALLPALHYRQSQQYPARPSISTNFDNFATNAKLQPPARHATDVGEASPDPHEFYRPYRESFRRESGSVYGDISLGHNMREQGTASAQQTPPPPPRPTQLSSRSNGYAGSSTPRYENRLGETKPPSPMAQRTAGSNNAATRATQGPRGRQSSLQALVNRFNQTPDEVPPVPSNPKSRSTSANQSPSNTHAPKSFKSRTSLEARQSQATDSSSTHVRTASRVPAPASADRRLYNRGNAGNMVKSPQRSRKSSTLSNSTVASQSTVDLSPKCSQPSRRPLFGEILSNGQLELDIDFGHSIPRRRTRRGSEGNVVPINSVFGDTAEGARKVSPTSPSAWYMGVTPSLEGIDFDQPVPSKRPDMHRRSRSDIVAGLFAMPPAPTALDKAFTPLSPAMEHCPPEQSAAQQKQQPQSRIPISTRRRSEVSESGYSTSSPRVSSAILGYQPLSRTHSRDTVSTTTRHKSAEVKSFEHIPLTIAPRKAPAHPNQSPPKESSSHLQAFISEPQPPLRSPPLRSSRPRRPVSTATTSASRARAADSVASKSRNDTKKSVLPKPDKGELKSLDFAARRERIQRAFTFHVKEQEIETERKRISLLESKQEPSDNDEQPDSHLHQAELPAKAATPINEEPDDVTHDTTAPTVDDTNTDDTNSNDTNSPETEVPSASEGEDKSAELAINVPKSVPLYIEQAQEDSPTLGTAVFLQPVRYDGSEPSSAQTSGTAETFFDQDLEPPTRDSATTHDSDSYNTVNYVLDDYHGRDARSRETSWNSAINTREVADWRQRTLGHSPLARQGNWDPAKVTQLYMQNQAREKASSPIGDHETQPSHSMDMPKPSVSVSTMPDTAATRVSILREQLKAPEHDEQEYRDRQGSLERYYGRPSQDSFNMPRDSTDSRTDGFSLLTPEFSTHRASANLTNADDWLNTSPSMLDWMAQQTLDTPVEERKQESLFSDKGLPQLPDIPTSGGLGLNLSIKSPAIMAEPLSKPTSVVPTTPAELKRLNRRKHILKELVDTEASFGRDMAVVIDIYKGTATVIIPNIEDIKILFGNATEILQFSQIFLDSLKQAIKSVYVLPREKRWKKRDSSATTGSTMTDDQASLAGQDLTDEERDRSTWVGKAFDNNLTQMEKVYTEYLKNHDAANQKLQELQKNDKIVIWLTECRTYANDLTTAWDLDSLLVKPVQRILKYPLLLKELAEVTPENHPDFVAIDTAAREMVGVSVRINEAKRRFDLVGQVYNSDVVKETKPKKKETEGRLGLPKAFARRSEKLKQQVGVTEPIQDRVYDGLVEKFGSQFFQLQVAMRDVEMYVADCGKWAAKFDDLIAVFEEFLDVGQTSHPEIESKWRSFRSAERELLITALTDHTHAVRKHVIEPMTTLLGIYGRPQRLMEKRKKRVMDYARYKAMKERGEKPDKKTAELGEQFLAVNDTLKDELPKLFEKTGVLVNECISVLTQLQIQWMNIWRAKLRQFPENHEIPSSFTEVFEDFRSDFGYTEAQVASLGLCNGSLAGDHANLINFHLSPSSSMNEPARRSSNESRTRPRAPSEASTSFASVRTRGVSDATVPSLRPRTASHAGRQSSIFSSAMPMSDAPATTEIFSHESVRENEADVLFVAASVYDFFIDGTRREAGYPYLTYPAGAIFDILGEKGELWLARNQDDRGGQVGWLWSKHFAKLAE